MANSRFGWGVSNNIGTVLSSHMGSLVGQRDRIEKGGDEPNTNAKREKNYEEGYTDR